MFTVDDGWDRETDVKNSTALRYAMNVSGSYLSLFC